MKNLRKASGLTKAEVAKRAGVSARTITDIEVDAENISLNTLEGVAFALGVRPAELLGSAPAAPPARSPEEKIAEAIALLKSALGDLP